MIFAASDNYVLKGQLKPVAYFSFHASDFEETFPIKFTEYVEDGLGEALGKFIRLSSGRHFLLKELLQAQVPRLYAEGDDDNCTNEGLDDLLSEMGILKDDCLWTLVEGYDAVECVLMREDDNGQRFEVEHFRNKIEAKLRLHELSAGGHKQFFWVESNNREQNAAEQPATRLQSKPK